ncbi:hypothetical protein N8I77_010865 [Diaporthe amygdali]|uniref:Uncharacterized protein n=1 Tax=Phomopsis amygdali TaxID=1214568 RepID=A0AAD9S847_PHOAM|nr:hypothetical protein N8I77_010865 [Diaporthe amygdali]KAK2601415.1 hypothetical protein N8I77_010865 [Diaporthe amygdali]
MPFSTKAPEDYSTNPNTIKARRRKMSLNGAKKVEDAARTADYKAMIYARKVVQLKPEYERASESEKLTMLEEAMRETMEKRRERGQDTMSKMAAFNAGTYRLRDSITGPQTRVPISAFLEDNGFVPSRPGRASHRDAAAGPSGPESASSGPLTPVSVGSAPLADMDGVGSAFAGANGLSSSANGQGSRATVGLSPLNRRVSAPVRRRLRSNNDLFSSQSSPSPTLNGVKASGTPAPFANITPEPMLASVEGDIPMANGDDSLSRIQTEMGHLRTICQNVVTSNNNIRELDLRNFAAEMGMEKNRVTDLEVRVSQLEGVVHALQNTALGNVVQRVNQLESIVEELKDKVGGGCDAEVAKMREVMGGLKGALDKVGGFV